MRQLAPEVWCERMTARHTETQISSQLSITVWRCFSLGIGCISNTLVNSTTINDLPDIDIIDSNSQDCQSQLAPVLRCECIWAKLPHLLSITVIVCVFHGDGLHKFTLWSSPLLSKACLIEIRICCELFYILLWKHTKRPFWWTSQQCLWSWLLQSAFPWRDFSVEPHN